MLHKENWENHTNEGFIVHTQRVLLPVYHICKVCKSRRTISCAIRKKGDVHFKSLKHFLRRFVGSKLNKHQKKWHTNRQIKVLLITFIDAATWRLVKTLKPAQSTTRISITFSTLHYILTMARGQAGKAKGAHCVRS